MGRSKLFWIMAPSLLATGLILFFLPGAGSEGSVESAPPPPPPLAELPLSLVGISVTVDPSPLLDALEAAVPREFGDLAHRLQHPAESALRYAFHAERDDFRAELRGDTLRVSTALQYAGQVWYASPLGIELTASCGVPGTGAGKPGARVELSLPFEIAEDWSVHARLQVDRVAPDGPEERCRASFLPIQVDVTDAIMDEIASWLDSQAAQLDGILAAFELPPVLDPYWGMIRDPIAIGDDAWLVLNPETLRFGSFEGGGPGGRPLQARIELGARPRIVLGARPERSDLPLPPLDEVGAASDPMVRSSQVLLEGSAAYGAMSALATRLIGGRELTFAGRTLEIRRVEVSGTPNGRMALDLDVEGAMRGRIHLVGTPTYDRGSDLITMPDLDFSVTTRNLLARSAAWVLRTGFPGSVSQMVAWPVEDLLAQGRELADQGLNLQLSDEARLEGTVGAMEVTDVAATEDSLVVRARFEALTALVIEP